MSGQVRYEQGTGWGRRQALGALSAVAAGAVLVGRSSPAGAVAPALMPGRVSVDFGTWGGKVGHFERYNNFGNVTAWPGQRAGDVAYFNRQGLHGDIYRVWLSSPNAPASVNLFNLCDAATGVCDFSSLDAYLTQASAVSNSLLVNLNPTDFVTGDRPLEDLEPLLEWMIGELKRRYPKVGYVEVFNEPDWQFYGLARRMGKPADQTTLQADGLYRFYVPFYRAVNKVNMRLPGGDRIKVGGPALSFRNTEWLTSFLDGYAADPDRRKRLDFFSYHAYLSWDADYQVPTMYSGNLSVVANDRTVVRGWLKQRGLDTGIPTFITETGIYPGPAYDDTNPANDYIRQAAGMATYAYLYGNQPNTVMFNWCVRHREEQRKDQLVTRTPNGPINDTFTPYGNVLLMQSKMRDDRVEAFTTPLVGDNGLYAIASKDHDSASVMVWNWQHTGTTAYRAVVDMARLPGPLRHGKVRRRIYRIDQATSNYFADPATAGLQLLQDRTLTRGEVRTQSLDLGPNAICLILLDRA